jgi:anti-sigma factor (TIGR02949 family)
MASEISCDEVLSEVEDYLHGELGPERSALLARHLAECTPCFHRAEFRRKLKEIVRSKCQSEAPEHLMARVSHAIRLERRSDPPPVL